MDEIEKLANDHWSYVEQIIRNEYDAENAEPWGSVLDLDAYCRRVGTHYKLAFIHGFKHGRKKKYYESDYIQHPSILPGN